MIAKGNTHNSGTYLAWYLAVSSKGTERAELGDLRGFASDNVFEALALVELQGRGTHCDAPLFHVQVRTPKGENLTREQWAHVAERIERKLKFVGQPRVMVFHRKERHEHMHLVWSRLDDELHPIDPGLYKLKLKEVCRSLEKEMGLTQVRNERDPDQKTKAAGRGEHEESRRLKTDLKEIREYIRYCWDNYYNVKTFTSALDRKGLILAQGDRRPFVIVDPSGGMHALSKRITGVTLGKTRTILSDIDRARLPTIEQARAMQRERRKEEEAKGMPQEPAVTDEDRKKKTIQEEEEGKTNAIGKEEEQKQKAIQQEEDKKAQAIAKQEEEKQKAIGEAEERKRAAIQQEEDAKKKALQEQEHEKQKASKDDEERKQQALAEQERAKQDAIRNAALKAEETRRAEFKAQVDRQVEQAKEMERQQIRIDAYKADLARQAEEARRLNLARETAQAGMYEIRNADYRYGIALAQHYDIRDPNASQARAAMAEYGAFLRDRENIERQIAQAKDPETRKLLELRKSIESAEYMVKTCDRIADQDRIITGRNDSEDRLAQQKRAEAFRKEAAELRKEYLGLQTARALDETKETKPAKASPAKAPEPKAPPPEKSFEVRAGLHPEPKEAPKAKPVETRRPEPEPVKRSSLMVEERPVGKPRGSAKPFDDFIKEMPLPAQEPEQTFTAAQIRTDPAARKAHYAPLVREQNRGEALDRIGEDLRDGRALSAGDLRDLNRDDLARIKAGGDARLKEMVQERERQRAQDRERER